MNKRDELRVTYDTVAADYADAFFTELERKPFDRVLLDRFAELMRGRGNVLDVGCGPGHVGRYLAERDIPVSGFDLSEEMVAIASRLNPRISFTQGTMLALPVADATLASIVSFYAIIHLARAEASLALREFYRILQPDGYLLLAFHGGEGEVHAENWFGHDVNVTATLFTGDEMANYARAVGFQVVELLERAPYEFEHQTRRVYLLVRKLEQPDIMPPRG
ncbi:MAG: class I SAM-dependent methyltransferase [Ktedonobacterales bacterium]